MALSNTVSSIVHLRQNDGTFIPHFPINTVDEVYYDIDNRVTLSEYLTKNKNKVITVNEDSDRFRLTPDDLDNMYFVSVESTHSMYYVIDETKLDSEEGYQLLLTSAIFDVPGGIPTLDNNGKLSIDDIPERDVVEVISYTDADIIV